MNRLGGPLMAALVTILLSAVPTSAQTYQGGVSAYGSDTAPTASYSATAGRFLFTLVTVNDGAGTTTCTAPSGWTKVHPDEPVYANYVICAATKTATGSDDYTWGLSTSASWAIGIVEFSGVSSPTAVLSATSDQNDVAPFVSVGGVTAGHLVIAGLVDTYEAALTGPAGFTALTLSPASGVHYGGNFVAMGALAWKVSGGGTETATWGQSDGHFTGLHISTYAVGGGGGGAPKRLLTLGVGDAS